MNRSSTPSRPGGATATSGLPDPDDLLCQSDSPRAPARFKPFRIFLQVVGVFVFGYLDLHWLLWVNALSDRSGLWFWVYVAKIAMEFVASVYAVFYLLVAIAYREPESYGETNGSDSLQSGTSVAYLCCDDFDCLALESLAEFCARTGCCLIVHDDSSSEASRRLVDRTAKRLGFAYRLDIRVLRRSHRFGGKPGAVNNLLGKLEQRIEFLLLCDSDSYLSARGSALQKALDMFADPMVAVVQFHNTGYTFPQDAEGYRILSESIDFYDAFVGFMDRFGWSPFLGHNALLRVSALREVGGFTPDQLADDIDLSVRLRVAGFKIRYAAFVTAAERHPNSYKGLRRRTAKWAYGCTQVLLRWGGVVLFSRRFTIADKATFFLTVSYYHFQGMLLLYLLTFYVVLPFDPSSIGDVRPLLLSAGMILLFTFLPSVSYFCRKGRLQRWPRATLYWGLTYGSQDLTVVRAITKCLFRQRLPWVPTNASVSVRNRSVFLTEVCFGALIVVVPALMHPTLLLLPTTALFAGKFLIAPWLNRWLFSPARSAPEANAEAL